MNPLQEQFDAVIVGSGFGGSIAARRLAEAGKSVLVLERGKRYQPGEFPRDVTDVDRLFWRYPTYPAYRGLYDVRFFSGLGAVVASGVGGGSLIYANILIRPDPVVFEDPRWPRSLNRTTLDPFYDRVAKALGAAPVPLDVPLAKRDAFRLAAQKTGHAVFDPDEAVSWQVASGPGRKPCQLVAQCEFGCPHGAKNTMDLTYLAEAERRGTQVRPESYVTRIEPIDRGYRVHYRDIASGAERQALGKRVVVAAGTLGTNELLLRCRDVHGTLPKLSPRLGHGYSGNGDFLGSIMNSQIELEPWKGPDVTSVIRYFEEDPRFTLAAPTFSRSVMETLTALGQGDGGLLRFLGPLLYPLLGALIPQAFRHGLLSRPGGLFGQRGPDPGRTTFLFAIGRDNANGRCSLKRGQLDVDWDYARENQALIAKMTAAMQSIAAVYGGSFAPVLTWSLFNRPFTVHSLGGCHVSDTPETGVVSPWGEVHGYPGLFVADGSVIPTAIGFHPVMTISAVCERIADAVAGA